MAGAAEALSATDRAPARARGHRVRRPAISGVHERGDREAGTDRPNGDRPLRREWRTLALLGVPTFALALAITTVTT
jgi:hypothetical protein